MSSHLKDASEFDSSLEKLKNEEESAQVTLEKTRKEAEVRLLNCRIEAQKIIEKANGVALEEKEKILEEARRKIDAEKTKVISEAGKKAQEILKKSDSGKLGKKISAKLLEKIG